MRKNILPVTLLTFFILVLFTLSEAVFIWKHPTQITIYGLSLAKFLATQGNTEKSLETLARTAYYFQELNTDKEVKSKDYDLRLLTTTDNFTEVYKLYLRNLPYSRLMPAGLYDFSRVLYEVGMLAYINENSELTYKLWWIASAIDPTLSYWPVELSNLYLHDGSQNKAKEVLENCQKIEAPKKHCSEFLEINVKPNEPIQPGFLLVESEKFYKFKSILFTVFPDKFSEGE